MVNEIPNTCFKYYNRLRIIRFPVTHRIKMDHIMQQNYLVKDLCR